MCGVSHVARTFGCLGSQDLWRFRRRLPDTSRGLHVAGWPHPRSPTSAPGPGSPPPFPSHPTGITPQRRGIPLGMVFRRERNRPVTANSRSAPMSPSADVGESQRRCGRVPAQMWASPAADVGESQRRCGRVPPQMWASPSADVGESRRRCRRVPAQGTADRGLCRRSSLVR